MAGGAAQPPASPPVPGSSSRQLPRERSGRHAWWRENPVMRTPSSRLRQVAAVRSARRGRAGRPDWSRDGLAGLIEPVGVADFAVGYWEREPVIIRRDDAEFYADLLTFDDVDHIPANSGLRESDLRVIVA